MDQYKKGPTKKKGRGKGARASQSSRLSAQSIATTVASDMTSLLEHPPDHEDSVMTTTSVMTQGGTKRSRAKKGTTAKGKKTRAKKDEAVEVLEDAPELDKEPTPPPPPPKPARGRKRASDTIEDSVLTAAEAPAAKKRATRTRKTNTTEASVVEHEPDQEMPDIDAAPKPPTKGKKGRSTNARNTRKVSGASTISTTSLQSDAAHMLDDDELDRQLQADLDRPLSDDENIAADSDSDRKKAPAKQKSKKAATKKGAATRQDETSDDHAMFDPVPPQIDEAAVDAELKALEAEMEAEPTEALQVPKKGRKGGTRKASKQTTKKSKGQEPPEPEPVARTDPETVAVDELAEGHDMSIVSNATVVRTSILSNAAPKKRGRPSKKTSIVNLEAKPEKLADSAAGGEGMSSVDRANPGTPAEEDMPMAQTKVPSSSAAAPSPLANKPLPPPPVESDEPEPPATPKAVHVISPAPAAKQAGVSPSPTPQSSDAENEPPSSKPSNTATSNRVALAPVAVTPVRASPSKRNILAGLQTSAPWTAVDVDMVFEELDKENALGAAKFLKSGRTSLVPRSG